MPTTANAAEAAGESTTEHSDAATSLALPVLRWRSQKLRLFSSGVWFIGVRRRLCRGRRPTNVHITTWPLIWILVFLVFPMLATWVVPYHPFPVYADLPLATHGDELIVAPALRIRPDGSLTLDGRVVSLEPSPEESTPDANMSHLDADLRTLRRNWDVLHPDQEFFGRILILAPGSTEWGDLRRVLLICAAAGYPFISFVIRLDPPMVGGAFGQLWVPRSRTLTRGQPFTGWLRSPNISHVAHGRTTRRAERAPARARSPGPCSASRARGPVIPQLSHFVA